MARQKITGDQVGKLRSFDLDEAVFIEEIAKRLTDVGYPIKVPSIVQARTRGQFIDDARVHMGGRQGRQPMYRWGDVVDWYAAAAARWSEDAVDRWERQRETTPPTERIELTVPRSMMVMVRAEGERSDRRPSRVIADLVMARSAAP